MVNFVLVRGSAFKELTPTLNPKPPTSPANPPRIGVAIGVVKSSTGMHRRPGQRESWQIGTLSSRITHSPFGGSLRSLQMPPYSAAACLTNR